MEANMTAHRPKQGLKGITFQRDNARRHIAKVAIAKISELGMNQMSHLSYSPEIDSCDFFLFEYFKHKLQVCSYDYADELFSPITDLMENLEKSFLHRVFDEWISRFHLVVESVGEYIQT
jgi:hypothetical protein